MGDAICFIVIRYLSLFATYHARNANIKGSSSRVKDFFKLATKMASIAMRFIAVRIANVNKWRPMAPVVIMVIQCWQGWRLCFMGDPIVVLITVLMMMIHWWWWWSNSTDGSMAQRQKSGLSQYQLLPTFLLITRFSFLLRKLASKFPLMGRSHNDGVFLQHE